MASDGLIPLGCQLKIAKPESLAPEGESGTTTAHPCFKEGAAAVAIALVSPGAKVPVTVSEVPDWSIAMLNGAPATS